MPCGVCLGFQPFVGEFKPAAGEHGEMIFSRQLKFPDRYINFGAAQFMNGYCGGPQGQAEQAFALGLQRTKSCTGGPQHVWRDSNDTAVATENEWHLYTSAAIENRDNGRRANHVHGLVLAAFDCAG